MTSSLRTADCTRTRCRAGVLVVVAMFAVSAACSSDSDENDAREGPAVEELGDPEGTDPLPALPDSIALPIVFVHGFAGSAQQVESQAMRFVANGYPEDRIIAYDHDGAGVDFEAYVEGLTEVVDAALSAFGVEQVYLVGHSRGTRVSTTFLSDPAQTAKVAKYVAIDGQPCPEVVPCVAPTQAAFPGQSHVEVATSAESFAMQYEFLVGEAPEVVDIVPQREPVEISGRAVNFPANTGRDATLDIWPIDADSGARVGDEPHATFELGTDGEFGPVELETGAHYEYALSSDASPVTHHLYLQPFVRSSHLVRLLSSSPDNSPTRDNTNVGGGHTALIVMRMREWYAQGDAATSSRSAWTATVPSTPSPTSSGTVPSGCTSTTTPPRRARPPSLRCPTSPPSRSRAAWTSTCRPHPAAAARSRSPTCPAETAAGPRR